MLSRTCAIVLTSVRYGDDQQVVQLFTELHGRLSFMIRIPKTQRGKLRKTLFQPLSLLEVEIDLREGHDLQRMRDVRRLLPFSSIPFVEWKLMSSLFLAEFLSNATRGEQQNEPLFRFVDTAVRWLDAADGAFPEFHLAFMLHTLRHLGIAPHFDSYEPNSLFDLREGWFTLAPTQSDVLSVRDSQLLCRLGLHCFSPQENYAPLSRDDRNLMTRHLLDYCHLHLPSFGDLRSLPVLMSLA